MNVTQTNHLVLKSVHELFKYNFFIPSYQRGYRWTETQVNQLLDDIWHYRENIPQHKSGEEEPFYCLQPIVVKQNNGKWEVIDGQQRLTTIFLILKKLQNQIETSKKNFSEISFETRTDSKDFLLNVKTKTEKEAKENVDYYHLWQAYNTIKKWFQHKADNSGNATPSAYIAPTFLNKTKVIWYEINDTENNNSIDIFTRLNIGKIPLTNAELIKALFLQKKDKLSEDSASLKQMQIASEWDSIEKALQDDAFWFFIYNPKNSLKYDNRIEYIFDLMKERTRSSERYYTFNQFLADFKKSEEDEKTIDNIWLEIKKYFLTFEEWFRDYELFHYIGYLIDCRKDRKNAEIIGAIKAKASDTTKVDFKDYLKDEIKKEIECDIDQLQFSQSSDKIKIRKILLLFNIQTVLETQKSDMRFPFHKYKAEKWDIEHICSQTDKPNTPKNRIVWIDDFLEFFTGTNEVEKARKFTSNSKKVNKICKLLLELKLEDSIDEEKFNATFKRVEKYLVEDSQVGEKDDISNLALLDAHTNRSYGNSYFPIKRKRIIDNDKKGIFVPIATKNLFLKYYSSRTGEIRYWTETDAAEYLVAIKETLKDFLPKPA